MDSFAIKITNDYNEKSMCLQKTSEDSHKILQRIACDFATYDIRVCYKLIIVKRICAISTKSKENTTNKHPQKNSATGVCFNCKTRADCYRFKMRMQHGHD